MSVLGLSGVFSGIDTDILIARSMAFNRIPLERLTAQKSTWQAKDEVHFSGVQNYRRNQMVASRFVVEMRIGMEDADAE